MAGDGRSSRSLLPTGESFQSSYMHRASVTHLKATEGTQFLVTASSDGFLKFWKKMPEDIIFVKQFRPHMRKLTDLAVSWDGQWAATTSADKSVKVFDVLNYDLINLIRLEFTPSALVFFRSPHSAKPKLMVADADSGSVTIFSPHEGDGEKTVLNVHRSPIQKLRFNFQNHLVLSVHKDSSIEYWNPTNGKMWDSPNIKWQMKTETDLYEFQRSRCKVYSIGFCPQGIYFATFSSDRRVRVFNFLTGKLLKQYDESIANYEAIQEGCDAEDPKRCDTVDFGRRRAIENELDRLWETDDAPQVDVAFDQSSKYILFGSMLGIKVVRLRDNTLVKILGRNDPERYLSASLFQGTVQLTQLIHQLARSNYTKAVDEAHPDPTFFCSAHDRVRFYLFTQREAEDPETREVHNEQPTREEIAVASKPSQINVSEAILRTNMGDIHLKLFPDEAPKAVENFATHSKNGYFNGLIFHRVIKNFMIQTGDPKGDGTGGESIWGDEFEDEISPHLKFDRPFVLAMANCGPGTNGSQFFITTAECGWLNGKHTIFGRVSRGTDVAQAIEGVRTKGSDKPEKDIKIQNIEIK